ncbi:DNA ligase [Helicobacter kayseriensis]|uniref:DNA ligase n=1 Tax=Helicobacter kayseriensis TaxID=2905877 RepID=UPI001E4B1A14|nr:DNA ligase [Helicobacter kayseriensis]MCE3046734.1 DNA ligase [Helicobacter kayseriensis]MCE3047964.1 DNA ligase [Helicobacter kayseriensis]
MITIVLKSFFLIFCFSFCWAKEILLLDHFNPRLIEENPQNYLWSEKLDGVRAYWDGQALYSRSGKKLNPPIFFIQNFPPFPIDGELWSKRGEFEKILSITQSKQDSSRWRELKFYIFEVPHQTGGLLERLQVLQDYLSLHSSPFIRIIPQTQVTSLKELQQTLQEITKLGGEGIVVRNKTTPYYTGRKKDSMKLKSYQDRECKIIQYIKGNGKLQEMMGSFLCQDNEKIIKIGSGMDEKFRKDPPPIGTIITYKFFGLTQKGNPRFPTFLRIRTDINLKEKP